MMASRAGADSASRASTACCIDCILCVAVIGLVRRRPQRQGVDTAYLRGSQGYEASALPFQGQEAAGEARAPAQPPAPGEIASSLSYAPLRVAADATLPAYKAPNAPSPPAWSWTGFYVGAHVGATVGTVKLRRSLRFIDLSAIK